MDVVISISTLYTAAAADALLCNGKLLNCWWYYSLTHRDSKTIVCFAASHRLLPFVLVQKKECAIVYLIVAF